MVSFPFYHCCGCIDLKVGTYIIAALGIIYGIYYIVYAYLHGQCHWFTDGDDCTEKLEEVAVGIQFLLYSFIPLGIWKGLSSLLLLIGTWLDNPGLIVQYLWSAIGHTILTLLVTAGLYVTGVNGGVESLASVAGEGVFSYFVSVVYSYYVDP